MIGCTRGSVTPRIWRDRLILSNVRGYRVHAEDMLRLDGTDLRSLPLDERRRRLQGLLPKGSPIVSEALSVAGRGRDLVELMCTNDWRGVVAKRLAALTPRRARRGPHAFIVGYCNVTFAR